MIQDIYYWRKLKRERKMGKKRRKSNKYGRMSPIKYQRKSIKAVNKQIKKGRSKKGTW